MTSAGAPLPDRDTNHAEGTLPRLVYIGDVPIEASYHGSALLCRLLHAYPAERLRIIEVFNQSLPERRLSGVQYQAVRVPGTRLLTTRFHAGISELYMHAAGWTAGHLRSLLRSYRAQAILSVAHGHSWLSAAALARRLDLPFHLIIHDDWPNTKLGLAMFRLWRQKQFERCYRQATSRLCISPFMAEEYQRRYNAPGTVLYPCRAAKAISFEMPPPRIVEPVRRLTVAFAGTINSYGYVQALRMLGEALQRLGGRLLLFGPATAGSLRAEEIGLTNIECRGLVSSSELIQRCREEADALFVPMSFERDCEPNMRFAFPSKLADYTSMGLPLLVFGPAYCSAVRWARDNPGVAEIVDVEDSSRISDALARLAADGEWRRIVATNALLAGTKSFSCESAQRILHDALLAG